MLTTIKTFRDPWEAHMFRARLAADGIWAFVADDQYVWMKWPISTALGGVRVQVLRSAAARADAVLARCHSGHYQAELAAMFGDIEVRHCRVCGSQDIKRRAAAGQWVFGLTTLFLFGIVMKAEARRCTCRVCGARWTEAAP